MKNQIKFFVVLLLVGIAAQLSAQIYPGTETFESTYREKGNPAVEFQLVPTKVDGNKFWIGGKILELEKGRFVCFKPEDVNISSDKVKLTRPEKMLLWNNSGNDVPAKYRFEFKLQEGYEGEEFTITIKNFYISDNKGKILFKIKKDKIKLTYSGLPEQKSAAELEEAELKKLNDSLTALLKKLSLVPGKIKKKANAYDIAAIEASDTEKLKRVSADLRQLYRAISSNRRSLKAVVKAAKNPKLSAVKEEAENILKINSSVLKVLKTKLNDPKIKNITAQEEKKIKDRFLAPYQSIDSTIKALSKSFREISDPGNPDGLPQAIDKIKAKTIKPADARKVVEVFNKDSLAFSELKQKKSKINDEYNEANPKLDEIDSLVSKTDIALTNLKLLVQKASNYKSELEEYAPPPSKTWIYILIAIILVGIIASYFYIQFLKKQKAKRLEKREKESLSEIEFEMDESDESPRGMIAAASDIPKKAYVAYDMEQMWNNSFVKTCRISHEAVNDIYKICRNEQRKAGQSGDQVAPEIGGFLLGRFYKHDTDKEQYDVIIDRYMQPSETEHQDVYQIKFGTKAMHELDKALEISPDKALVGWFHTHPGHSPFLSQPDLNIHNGTFTQNWQLAIVVDPYNEYDTGIFTRYRNEEGKRISLNNSGQKQWADWHKLYTVKSETGRKSNLPELIRGKYYKINAQTFWEDTVVRNIRIAHDLIFDLEEIRDNHKSSEEFKFIGEISGYYDETDDASGVFDIYLSKLHKGESASEKTAWLGILAGDIQDAKAEITEACKSHIDQAWHTAVIISGKGKKISFLTVSGESTLNFDSSGERYLDFDELNRQTMKK